MTAYIAGDNMITSLGFSTSENFSQMKEGITGIKKLKENNDRVFKKCAISLVDTNRLDEIFSDFADVSRYTQLEKMAITSVRIAAEPTDLDLASPKTLFILSTTKGNIDLLGKKDHPFEEERLQLWRTARIVSLFFENPNEPVVVSNACISGLMALLTATRILESGRFENVVVVGGDLATEFVVAGFQSLKAMSNTACKPYDKKRNGLSLGEGCGTLMLTSNPDQVNREKIVIRGGAVANDANHISGPSRTGEGLLRVIDNTLLNTGESRENINTIAAHGTATVFNDDMESIALDRAGMSSIPLNSLKGYIGHTLGAAGVLETAIAIRSMKENLLIATKGFKTKGTTKKINVVKTNQIGPLNHSLKLAAGFGGCNAGLLISKDESF
jgi:3-oxoacyl-[acyl-carrier-protein] synthase I